MTAERGPVIIVVRILARRMFDFQFREQALTITASLLRCLYLKIQFTMSGTARPEEETDKVTNHIATLS